MKIKINKYFSTVVFLGILLINVFTFTKVYAVEVTRLSGSNRYETAVAISKNNWNTSDNVILSTGQRDNKFADALAGTSLAYNLNAPLLLTNTDNLSRVTLSEIKRLNIKNVYLLGGIGVISTNVERNLKNEGYNVIRLSGKDRYETAVKIGEEACKITPAKKIYLTTGLKFQYAITSSSYLGKEKAITLFTDGSSLNSITKETIGKLKLPVTIMGGNRIVSANVENELKAMGVLVTRIYGDTPKEFNTNILNMLGKDSTGIAVANSIVFADSLSGSVIAAKNNLAIALVDSKFDYDIDKDKLSKVLIYGGNAAVSSNIENYFKNVGDSKKNRYNIIRNAISNCEDSVICNNMAISDIKNLIEIVLNQNPDINYVDYCTISSDGNIKIKYKFSKDRLLRMKSETDEKANLIISNIIKPEMTQLQKAKAIHDYIIINTKYDYNNYERNKIPEEDYTAYGVLINHTGVCQGYSAAFNLLARKVDIKCMGILGKGDGGLHQWNMVMIDGKVVYIDVTWDDPVPDRPNKVEYKYFNINEKKMSKDHMWDKVKFSENYLNH